MKKLVPDESPDRPQPLDWDAYSEWLLKQWRSLLNSDPPEAKVQDFLESHPALLPGADGDIGPGGHHGPHHDAVIAEPPLHGLGRDRRPDFMWVTRSTSLITPILIEIEQPGKRWFNKSGTPTAVFTQALDQLTDWKLWFSVPANQLIFRETYLENEFPDRHLHPQFVLIFGRQAEFDPSVGLHDSPAALRRKRDFMRRVDESFMTFDSLRPREHLRDYVTLKRKPGEYVMHRMPPCFTTGPTTRELASFVRRPDAAIDETPLWSTERKQYVLSRWRYWQSLADDEKGAGDTGELAVYSQKTNE